MKKKTNLAAFKYLCDKQQAGKKGKYLKYEELQIADYLLPDSEATIEEKFDMFALRTEMNDLPHNFGKTDPCKYGCQEDMSNIHIFRCRNPARNPFEKLNIGNVKEKVEALKIFQNNLKIHF